MNSAIVVAVMLWVSLIVSVVNDSMNVDACNVAVSATGTVINCEPELWPLLDMLLVTELDN